MIRSMTGFGSAAQSLDGVEYGVEIRSVNNRFFKCQVRVPDSLQELEVDIERFVSGSIVRGSVVLTVRYVDHSPEAGAAINRVVVERYLSELRGIAEAAGVQLQTDLAALLMLPGAYSEASRTDISSRAKPAIMKLVEKATTDLQEMRHREGDSIQRDLEDHCGKIAELLSEVDKRAPEVVRQYQSRLQQRVELLANEAGASLSDQDLIREVAIFAERSDINEELTRLRSHIDQLHSILNEKNEAPVGRTLDFLSQEMLREANTIASKCLDATVSRHVVLIKGLIDRIKEQVQNVE
ncbi:MAG: YicC family protein [Phycisphaerales bacterium]|nr:YicC family protein [Phycisphaerales bacterium]